LSFISTKFTASLHVNDVTVTNFLYYPVMLLQTVIGVVY